MICACFLMYVVRTVAAQKQSRSHDRRESYPPIVHWKHDIKSDVAQLPDVSKMFSHAPMNCKYFRFVLDSRLLNLTTEIREISNVPNEYFLLLKEHRYTCRKFALYTVHKIGFRFCPPLLLVVPS